MNGAKLNTFAQAADLFSKQIGNLPHEELWGLFLAQDNTVLSFEQLGKGDDHHVSVAHSVTVNRAKALGAKKFVVSHNHPQKDGEKPVPSWADIQFTIALGITAGEEGLNLVDHIVVAGHKATSIRFEVIGNDPMGRGET